MGRSAFYAYAWLSDEFIASGEGRVRERLAEHFADSVRAHGGVSPDMVSYREATRNELDALGMMAVAGATCYRLDGYAEQHNGGR